MHPLPNIVLKRSWRSVAIALRRSRARRRLNRDLGGLRHEQLTDLLDLAGIGRSDLFAGSKGAPRHRWLMGHMMARFGIDREAACERCWRDVVSAETACARCPNAAKCRRWLNWGRDNGAPHVFCRNAGLFTRLRLHLESSSRG